MTTAGTCIDYSTTTTTTMHIVLAYLNCRLTNQTKTDKLRDFINKCECIKKDKDFANTKWDPLKYSKYLEILYSPERTYQRCDIKNYTDGKAFVSYMERHPTYKSSQIHNNNVTWYQISEIMTFTVDLLEECYEAGRAELIPFLIDWSVSCINQQNCIHTGDGWADILTILPTTSDGSSIMAPLNSQQGNSIAIEKDVISDEEDPLYVTSSGSSSKPSNVNSSILSIERNLAKSFPNDEILKDNTSLPSIDKELLDSSTVNELILLRCSCGNEKNITRIGNFFGACEESGCGKVTCSLCSGTFAASGTFTHLNAHKLKKKSLVTKEHVKNNTEAYNAVCCNCKSSNCVRLAQTKYLGKCKLCKMNICLYPGCGKSGKANIVYMHIYHRHFGGIVPRRLKLSESRELRLLKCGTCKNISNMVRDRKFWSKCGTPSCKDYGIVFCLICGCKPGVRWRANHLRYHGAESYSLITDEHVDSNMKLYNKTCGNCKVQSCVQYNLPTTRKIAKCKCCTYYVCMFPDCERYYSKASSMQTHCSRH